MFTTIYKFEIKSITHQKSFKISTLITCILVFLLTFIPRLNNNSLFNNVTSNISKSMSDDKKSESLDIALFIKDKNVNQDILLKNKFFKNAFLVKNENEIKDLVEKEDVKKGILIYSPEKIKIYVKKISMYEKISPMVEEAIKEYKQQLFLSDYNIDIQDFYKSFENSHPDIEIEAIQKNETVYYPIAYGSLMIMYMMILMYAQSTAMSVAREKNDRTMELLITSANPTHLITGKVLASCTVAICKMLLIIFSGIIGMMINKKFFPMYIFDVIAKSFTPLSLIIFILFFLFGLIMYNMLFAACGALVDRLEDIGSIIQPLILIFVFMFFGCMLSINIPGVKISNILSMIPLSSPLVMFSNYVMKGFPLYMVVISFFILLLTTILLSILAGRIYRLGSLSYGNKIGFIKAVKLIFSKK